MPCLAKRRKFRPGRTNQKKGQVTSWSPIHCICKKLEQSVDVQSCMIFEMNRQLGNCIVEEETCADCCSECAAGSGKSHRNFSVFRMLFLYLSVLCWRQGWMLYLYCVIGKILPWVATHDKTLEADGPLYKLMVQVFSTMQNKRYKICAPW